MSLQIPKSLQHQQLVSVRRPRNFFVLQDPSVVVRHEGGIKSGRNCGIDVRLGAVTHHPRGIFCQSVFLHNLVISGWRFLRDDFYSGEELLEP